MRITVGPRLSGLNGIEMLAKNLDERVVKKMNFLEIINRNFWYVQLIMHTSLFKRIYSIFIFLIFDYLILVKFGNITYCIHR